MSTPEQTVAEPLSHQRFTTTHWSVVLEAGGSASPEAAAALAKLCQTYWPPVYSFLRRSGRSPEDSKDLTQEFFRRLLEKQTLKALDRDKGRFRSFLLVVLKRFLAAERDRAHCQKRGGGVPLVSLDDDDAERRHMAEVADDRTPETVFEKRWALALLEHAIRRLERELADHGKQHLFERLKGFLTGEQSDQSQDAIAGELGMTTGTLRVTIHRMRQRYRELLRWEIAQTVGNPAEIDDEIRHLFAALST